MSETPSGGVRGHSCRGAHSAWLTSAGRFLVGSPGDRTDSVGPVVIETLNGGMVMKIFVLKMPKAISRVLRLFSRKKKA